MDPGDLAGDPGSPARSEKLWCGEVGMPQGGPLLGEAWPWPVPLLQLLGGMTDRRTWQVRQDTTLAWHKEMAFILELSSS